MTADELDLRNLTIGIADAENRGAREWLAGAIAPQLAFQRADAALTLDDRAGFLAKVTPGGDRVTHIIEPIRIYGSRAVVECLVRTGGRRFHNLRLLVKRGGQWMLLGWANEEVPPAQPDQ